MFKACVSIMFILTTFLPCFALTDAEYKQMSIESPEFKKADSDLLALWKNIMKTIKGDFKKQILNEQREWVKSGRDKSANEFMAVGLNKNAAYTRAVIKRIHELQVVEYNMNLSQSEIDRGMARANGFYETEEDDPSFYLNKKDLVNENNDNNDNSKKIIWRHASKHEPGDLEPSDFCYISIKDNTLLMHWKTAGDPETVDVYSINQNDGSFFCATKAKTYVPDDSNGNKFVITNDFMDYAINICGKISGNELDLKQLKLINNKPVLDNWIILEKQEAYLQNAFPKQILKEQFNMLLD